MTLRFKRVSDRNVSRGNSPRSKREEWLVAPGTHTGQRITGCHITVPRIISIFLDRWYRRRLIILSFLSSLPFFIPFATTFLFSPRCLTASPTCPFTFLFPLLSLVSFSFCFLLAALRSYYFLFPTKFLLSTTFFSSSYESCLFLYF